MLRAVSLWIRERTEASLLQDFKEGFSKECKADWRLDLRLIVGGGGSTLKTYQNAAKTAFTVKGNDSRQPEIVELSTPGDFLMGTLPAEDFHRFAVAYGLSWGVMALPELVTPSQVEPVRKLKQRVLIDILNDG